MKNTKILWILLFLLTVARLAGAECTAKEGFEAPVAIHSIFPDQDVVSDLKGTFAGRCDDLRFDFHAEDAEFPSDVTVLALPEQKKLLLVSHASKSYFEDVLTHDSLDQLNPLLNSFGEALSIPGKAKFIREREIRGERCKEYQYPEGVICLSVKNPQRPLALKIKKKDGSVLDEQIGPYRDRTFAEDHFRPPKGFKKESTSASQLLNLFGPGAKR